MCSREVSNHGRADAVATDVVRLVVALRKAIVVFQSHQPRGFAGRQQPGAHFLAFDDQDRLARGAAGRRPKTSRDLVEANLRALALQSVLVGAGPAVDRPDGAPPEAIARDTFCRCSGAIMSNRFCV